MQTVAKLSKMWIVGLLLVSSNAASAAITYDDEVTPGIIFGSGNANGGFTIDRENGVELGLRGKLRHNASGLAENTFNSNGDGTYTFQAIVAPTQSSPTAEWSFEWSINTDFDGSSGFTLDDLTFELALDTDPTAGVSFYSFDLIHDESSPGVVYWDHSMGDNFSDAASDYIAADEASYLAALSSYNVAQNSWKPHWFIPGFDPELLGEYTLSLSAYNGSALVASTSIMVNTVPEPSTLALLGLSGMFGTAVYLRCRWA
ncbi:PEP-CTERM sorting domain-containing protein [Aeoliella mucimassa]|uniref:Ice-binding protein C-terminal domain-containing protein n=1 Tax=Aeoliella mucimassa TaxID=2527972 RepID=A0A518AH73_9BACT|nr:PEP-CTERM sorting domain-containing protein [Aeoliella mucimassa]QDU54044.1 hypothetical protein Pan181_02240 [Aeoliella mucimassa]